MTTRLSPLDASFLSLERPHAVMHVGAVLVFGPQDGAAPEPPTQEELVALVTERISRVRRYRQRLRSVPGGVANPVWVDDAQLDLDYHVRRSALPRPGTPEQLDELVARVLSRPLDRERPLWELYLVEGLRGGGFALVTKTHQALVDGEEVVDLAELLLDDHPVDPAPSVALEAPAREPADVELVVGALLGAVRQPVRLVEAAQRGADGARDVGRRLLAGAGQVASVLASSATRSGAPAALNGATGQARRFAAVQTDLAAYRHVREVADRGDVGLAPSVNDVVLAVLAGGLRTWLEARGEHVTRATSVRVLVPVGVWDEEGRDLGSPAACFVDLPVGEPSPLVRLHQVAYAMWRQVDRGRAVGAGTLAGLAGFASPTLHSVGARLGTLAARRLFNLVVTNAPGPQEARYLGQAAMTATYPVIPVVEGQVLAVGVTSYAGRLYYGITADRELVPDLDVLAGAILDSLSELVESADPHPSAPEETS